MIELYVTSSGGSPNVYKILLLLEETGLSCRVKRPLAPYPNAVQYMHRIEGRPAYERAMSRANPNGAHW
jgi:glutathione S-transferase